MVGMNSLHCSQLSLHVAKFHIRAANDASVITITEKAPSSIPHLPLERKAIVLLHGKYITSKIFLSRHRNCFK